MTAADTRSAVEPAPRLDPRILLAVAVTVVSWGSAFAGIRAALQAYAPAHVALLRFVVASVALGAWGLVTRMGLPARRDLPGLALIGAIGIAFYNLALNYGETTIAAGTASLLIASAPIWLALLATTLRGERLRAWGWLGILLSFAGVAAIVWGNRAGLQLDPRALVVLAAAVASSLYSLGQKPYLARYSALQCTTYAVWAGTLLLLFWARGLPAAVRAAPLGATLAVVYLGIVPAAVGYVGWGYILARVPAATAGSFLYLVPAAAMLIAWLWLGEVPGALALAGGALVLCGVIVVNRWGRRR